VAQTFFVDEDLQGVCYLDAIITMVDAAHIDQQLSRERPEGVENEAEEQLAFADKIILNKLDLVPDRATVEATKARLRAYNPNAEIIETTNSDVAAERLMGLDAFNLARVMEKEPDFLDTGAEHKHDTTVTSFCVQSDEPVVRANLERWIQNLLEDAGKGEPPPPTPLSLPHTATLSSPPPGLPAPPRADLFRYKGIINVKGCAFAAGG
jgi:G3E family GTPase